ncbi:hypothetical protein DEO23_15680 [Brachybacterium endophyticum]|uniref:DNA-directed DNA polymerase n=1 Tax=Brachybacterium endophyticum TaxID=2182385 RepID=A0A2U2RGM0_9MICO|nr:DNA polymerase [Brachybacterium endophyticum]PWH04971.1 hypothetical protein DEO23_15680 [Brachybacterium endophyticum]
MSIVYLDLETASKECLWDYGPGFVRLAGYAVDDSPVVTTTDIDAVVRLIESADFVVGHNVLGFDLPALERYHGLDVGRLVREYRVVDTLLVARQNDPPLADSADARRYNLDAVCRRIFGDGKVSGDGGSVLKTLARNFDGYDQIPIDHPDYVRYLVQDVELVRDLSKLLVIDEYVWREHRVMWRLGHIASSGWRVDRDLAGRLVAGQKLRIELQKRRLHERFGLPLGGSRPHATTAGKLALEHAFRSLEVEPPRTASGAIATGKDVIAALAEDHADNLGLVELCEVLRTLNGGQSAAQTLLDHVRTDGRVHPNVDARQATGRISVTKPGLTVLGKRDRKNALERALLLPDPGHVLISADLAQIDARAIAMHCQDPEYIAAFAPGKDLHDEMAAAVFGEGGWDRSAGHHPRRSEAKPITHATSYGMGPRALAQLAGISEEDARRHLAVLDLRFPGLAQFKAWVREEGRRQVLCTGFGRWVRIQPGREYTKAPASMGQGTARDLMMEGVLRLPEWLLPGLRAIIHDEIVLSVPEDRADEAERALRDALQFDHQLTPDATPVRVLAETSDRGRDWLDCYRTEKSGWPEVARAHRDAPTCLDPDCSWHVQQPVATTPTDMEIAP